MLLAKDRILGETVSYFIFFIFIFVNLNILTVYNASKKSFHFAVIRYSLNKYGSQ